MDEVLWGMMVLMCAWLTVLTIFLYRTRRNLRREAGRQRSIRLP